jgi:NAD(P)H-hydrate epimerase
MERAGAATFTLAHQVWPETRRWAVVCGVGNNAGDGYVIARLAYLAGIEVELLHLGGVGKLKGDAQKTYKYCRAVGVSAQPFAAELLADCDLIVDAVFGTGLSREVEGKWALALDAINQHPAPVVTVDVPSGLHADSGAVMGTAIQADLTLTFIGLKQGLFTGHGPQHCGSLVFDDLNVPDAVYSHVEAAVQRLDASAIHHRQRPRHAHKGDFGHVLIIGGEHGYTGAARLAAQAALRCGAGKVSLATRQYHAALMNLTAPEIMCHGVERCEMLEALLARVDAVAIGPGLGQGEWALAMLKTVVANDKPLLIDADGLNVLSHHLLNLPANTVLTPHPGEAGRLLGISTREVETDRIAAAQTLRDHYKAVCVLKGAGTVIADGDDLSICSAGNPGMACGGMGDVLSGVIAALLGQGLTPGEAARQGVCIHAAAADKGAGKTGEIGLTPSEVVDMLPQVLNP